jgi:hypothetical protein
MHATSAISAICKTVQDYFEGMHFGDTGRLRAALHGDAHLFGFEHGQYVRESLEQWTTAVDAMDKPSESGELFDMRIVSIDVTGSIAQVKAAELYAGLRYTVYLSLMSIGGDWKIVNKTYNGD